MIYLRAGVYAEGPTDYRFLLPLLNRHLDTLAAPRFSGDYQLADTIAIDARVHAGTRRADRIAAAIAAYADTCELFVIHSDGAGDSAGARSACIEPGIARARASLPNLIAVGCVPVREIEAWLLTDPEAFRASLGGAVDIELPTEPEKELDPKATLEKLLTKSRVAHGPESIHALFGESVRFEALRTLPAFRSFETELVEAIKQVARSQAFRI